MELGPQRKSLLTQLPPGRGLQAGFNIKAGGGSGLAEGGGMGQPLVPTGVLSNPGSTGWDHLKRLHPPADPGDRHPAREEGGQREADRQGGPAVFAHPWLRVIQQGVHVEGVQSRTLRGEANVLDHKFIRV